MLRNPTELTYWVDKEPRVRYRMTPPEDVLVMPEHSETMLPKQWVLKEVLELFGFVCRDDSEAYWAVDKELTYVSIPPSYLPEKMRLEADRARSLGLGRGQTAR